MPEIILAMPNGGGQDDCANALSDDNCSASEDISNGAGVKFDDGDENEADPAPDPFDPASLRLPQGFADTIGVRKVLTTVPCRKPNRHEFVRVRSGNDWRLETGIFEDKINRDIYLVRPDLWVELMGEAQPVCLFLAVNRQGDPFIWPAKLPGTDGKSNTWNESALAAARRAESKWIRVAANMPAGMYDVYEAAAELSHPIWPDLSFWPNPAAMFPGSLYPISRPPGHPITQGVGVNDDLRRFTSIWAVDFEFFQPDGGRPDPRCMVAREHRSGRTIRVWADELQSMAHPPLPVGGRFTLRCLLCLCRTGLLLVAWVAYASTHP